MSIHFSPTITARESGSDEFSIKAIDLHELGEHASPIVILDDFRVRGQPFEPHPHAGFSAVTYVFEDSQGALRSRDSLGNDVVVGPGGIVWAEAGSGMIHHEVPAESNRELHGLQLFVNLSAKNKFVAPRMLRLQTSEVPEWRSNAGNRARVVVGSFEGLSSPLVPAEPFDFLEVQLRREMSFDLPSTHRVVAYIIQGDVLVRADGREQKVSAEQALALYGEGGRVTFEVVRPAHFVILSGADIREPSIVEGNFIMNERSQIDAAVARYRAGAMGYLAPLASS